MVKDEVYGDYNYITLAVVIHLIWKTLTKQE